MKSLLIILVVLAVGLGVIALRKESVVAVVGHSTEFLVDGSRSRVLSSKHEGVTTIDLKTYAKVGLVRVLVAIVSVAVTLRRRKNA